MDRDPLTVLIVDDELPLRQELRLFSWQAHHTELIGEAENGEEALRFCRNFSPDIVITDITMPVMNGLELFRSLKSEFPHTQVILLTCHSEFAYAQEAIKLGAVGYLVKVTMDEHDLEQALRKAKEAAYREQSLQRGQTQQLRWEASKRLLQISQKEFEPPGSAARDADADGGLETLLQTSFRVKPPFHLAALHVEAKKESRLFIHHEIEELLIQLEHQHSFAWIPAEDGIFLLIFHTNNSNLQFTRSNLETITEQLYRALDRIVSFLSDAFRLYCVVSEPVRKAADFAAIYRNVCEKPVSVFYDSASRVFMKQLTGPASLEMQMESEMLAKLHKAQWDREQLVQTIREDFVKWAMKYRIAPEELKAFVADWLHDWRRESPAQAKRSRAAARIASVATVTELAAAFMHEIQSLSGIRKPRKEINDAKQFIAANLAKPITLAAVSGQVGLSPHYLSRLFREETGISFNDFVTKKRIEKAARLLQNTSLRVYEVAQEVGIPSYRYFTAIFREWTGAAPTELKKSSVEALSWVTEQD